MLDVIDEAQWKHSGVDLSHYTTRSVRSAYEALPVEQQRLLPASPTTGDHSTSCENVQRIHVTTHHSHGCEPDLEGTMPARNAEQLDGYVEQGMARCRYDANCEVLDRFRSSHCSL